MSSKQPNGQVNGASTKDDSGTNSQRLRNLPEAGGKDGVRNFGNQRRMISELERINALNLEPSLPKQDDGSSGSRNVSRLNQNREALKGEFQSFLKTLQSQDKDKGKAQQANASTAERGAPTGSNNNLAALKQVTAPIQGGGPMNPQFVVNKASTSESKSLGGILDEMLKEASKTAPDTVGPDWPEAKGPSFHDVLGEPGQMKAPTSQLPQNHDQQQHMPNQQRTHNNNHNNASNSRPQGPPGDQVQQQVRPMGPPGGQQPNMPPQGYVMSAGPGQGGQQMMFQIPGQGAPQNMMPIQGMPMQGQNVMMMTGQPQMFGGQPQMNMMQGMMVAPGQQGGQMPQGMMNVPHMGGADQQQQQMMFVPMMMPADQAYGMNPQGMQQGYPPQQGGPGNQQQAPFMMPQQPMYHQQGPQN